MLKRSDCIICVEDNDENELDDLFSVYIKSKDGGQVKWLVHRNISEIERFIDYKIRESLRFSESASEFFSYKSTYHTYDKLNKDELNFVMNTRDISEVQFTEKYIVINLECNFLPISEKDRLLEWLEFHGITINLEEQTR